MRQDSTILFGGTYFGGKAIKKRQATYYHKSQGSGLSLRGSEMVSDRQGPRGELWGRGAVYVLFLELGTVYTDVCFRILFALYIYGFCFFFLKDVFILQLKKLETTGSLTGNI